MSSQVPLFEPVHPRQARVNINDIRPWHTSGARSATRHSIATLGFASAVLLQELPEPVTDTVEEDDATTTRTYYYRVIDAARRLEDARAQGIDEVPALILPADVDATTVAALQAGMNLSRKPNVMQEAKALGEIASTARKQGIPKDEVPAYISRTLGLPRALVTQRLHLLSLPKPIQQGVSKGKIAAGVANKIARLPVAQQTTLTERYAKRGRLTAGDVKDARRAKQEATMSALPEQLFTPPENDLNARARSLITQLLDEGLETKQLMQIVHNLTRKEA